MSTEKNEKEIMFARIFLCIWDKCSPLLLFSSSEDILHYTGFYWHLQRVYQSNHTSWCSNSLDLMNLPTEKKFEFHFAQYIELWIFFLSKSNEVEFSTKNDQNKNGIMTKIFYRLSFIDQCKQMKWNIIGPLSMKFMLIMIPPNIFECIKKEPEKFVRNIQMKGKNSQIKNHSVDFWSNSFVLIVVRWVLWFACWVNKYVRFSIEDTILSNSLEFNPLNSVQW